ncbi:MAG: glucosyl-3-phosphoglycerate synthase [Solirubrobacterales bacterium]|nr:glucosyl-3-phosphoglycerate synthase [Solirubrobacterales bacterium]MCB0859025.1 glucosyl-3-phosphoglycerate synthase [Solirubrobacterales bacterium]HRV60223.1 glucosyl-3-phosphoglycerate synthase [Solirubrobacterales bacterium]
MLDTFDHRDFAAADISRNLRETVSVVIPTRNTAGTIAATVAELKVLADDGLVEQILVVDADSPDGTASLARDAGAEVVSENELVEGHGPCRGKGDAMWRALAAVTGDIVVYIDGDIADFGRHYVTGVTGPLTDPGKHFVKGRYQRPFRYGESEEPSGGGRVTELAARPLLARLAPELLAFDQPLAGEVAARRELLEQIPFACGYGVEISMLIDVWDRVGIEGMAQVELGTKRNAHQPLSALSGMSSEVIAAMAAALDRLGREDTGRLEMVEGSGPEVTVRPAFATVSR